MFKRNQIVTVGIAGLHCQYQGRIVRRAAPFGNADGWWIVNEIPADDERRSLAKQFRDDLKMCVHESQIAAA